MGEAAKQLPPHMTTLLYNEVFLQWIVQYKLTFFATLLGFNKTTKEQNYAGRIVLD